MWQDSCKKKSEFREETNRIHLFLQSLVCVELEQYSLPITDQCRQWNCKITFLNNPASFKTTHAVISCTCLENLIDGKKLTFYVVTYPDFPSLNQNLPELFWKGQIFPSPQFWDLVFVADHTDLFTTNVYMSQLTISTVQFQLEDEKGNWDKIMNPFLNKMMIFYLK